MAIGRRLVGAATLIIGGVWFAASFDFIRLSFATTSSLWTVVLVLWGLALIMDWRARKNQQLKEPSPAQSARNVILATGFTAAVITARSASGQLGFMLPASIVMITVVLGYLAYRFASKYRNQIGEARFDTTANGS